MPPQRIDVNPSDETIHLGPLAVRFLITGEDASGSLALFELTVPAAQRLTESRWPTSCAAMASRRRRNRLTWEPQSFKSAEACFEVG